ncbi:sucrose phosphorylase [Oerskovia jenensis]|uniref:sucrose phosphorylase n=1 Tax=Oerskovia jenensis TaxID=162169 RepID=UPI0036DF0C27
MNRGVHLLAYADRFGGSIAGLGDLLDGPLSDFSGVHVLPFFVPFDGDDAGFDPSDHATVDPRLGSWDDVRTLAARGRDVTADLIVNHVSSSSVEFQDWLANGASSPHDGMFLTFDTVFGGQATEADVTAFYRPRPGLPFTAYRQADGRRRLVWTTFMESQVDIDVHHPAGEAYLRRTIRALADGGVRVVRVDAVGYAVKTPGTDSFMTDETLEFVRRLTRWCHDEGLEVLVEVHAHHTQQLAIAPLVDWVYDFALPPLLLHAFETAQVDHLARWLDLRPRNAITVLDTHDGIGVIDAGPSGGRPGLIDEEEMAAVFAAAERATDGESGRASVVPAWASMPHQINATFAAVCGDDATYLLARAVQLFVPGLPQIYYVGLLAGGNDVDLYRSTGQGRDINRHRYDAHEIEEELRRPVVRALLALVRLRARHPALDGEFTWERSGAHGLSLTWTHADARLRVAVDLADRTFVVSGRDADRSFEVRGVEELAALDVDLSPRPAT